MCTPPPSLSSIEYDAQDSYFHPQEQNTLLLGVTHSLELSSVTMNPAKARPRPIVRLPPPGPTHASQPVRLEDPSSSSRPHSDPLANGNPAWQDFFKTLMADRDSTATKPTEIPTVGPTIIDFTNGSIPDDAASSGTTEAQGQDTEVNRTGKKKRRRHKAGKKKREANAHSEIDGEALQSPSLKALAPTVSPSSAALLLQNARNNWVNVCHLLMSEVSPDDREVLKQITYFISRLGTIPDHATTETQSASLGTKESPTTQNSSESPLDGEMNPEHGTAASPPEG